MKKYIIYTLCALLSLFVIQACGEAEEEPVTQEPIEQEDHEAMIQEELERMRQDSIEQARKDSIAAAEEKRRFEFTDDGRYVVQIESWRSEEKAENQAQKWIDRGYDKAFVVEYRSEETGDIWYRVRIGQFENREMAERFKTVLAEDYDTDSWISDLESKPYESSKTEDE